MRDGGAWGAGGEGCARLAIVCAVLAALLAAAQANLQCDTVRPLLFKKGLSASDILDSPQPVASGGACGCCAASAATRLSMSPRRDLETTSKAQALRIHEHFATKAKKFDEKFLELLERSKRDLHDMFTKTYGLIYEKHALLFADLFTKLEQYYTKGGLDLAKVMDGFFVVLYKKMFTVINAQYHFDDSYLSCVSEHMRELQPFGDVPQKLGVQVKRAFVATRTFTRSLNSAAEVSRNVGNLRVASWCGTANHCAMCSGVSEPSCSHLCLNRARACFPQFADLSTDWDAFVDAMDKVADRLIGPFNIANVVEPIDIKISEAIMNFQEHSAELSKRVFTGCGKPVLGHRTQEAPGFYTRQKRDTSYRDDNAGLKISSSENSDDFEIETSYESLLKKNPFILSRGNSRWGLTKGDNTDLKAKEYLNMKIENGNELEDPDDTFANVLRNGNGKIVFDKLHDRMRFKRDANPEPGKGSKEIDFETYNFDDDENRRKKKGRGKQGGKKKKIEVHGGDESDGDEDRTLERLVREIRREVRETRHIWSQLPQIHCNVNTSNNIPTHGTDEKCWNGTSVGRYLPPLAGEGTSALATNPEAGGSSPSTLANSGTSNGASASTQQFTLRTITTKLGSAYNGLDVQWSEEEETTQWPSGFSGSGSGNGNIDGDGDDDGDDDGNGGLPDEETENGSGHHPEIPTFDPDINTGHFVPPVVIKNPDTDVNERTNIDLNNYGVDTNNIDADTNRESSGTSNAVDQQEMSLQRALITYLFPIVCVWFGGIITDIA